MDKRPEVVTLCGSTRFKDKFDEVTVKLTLEGKIVMSIGCDMRNKELFGHMDEEELEFVKAKLDVLHLRKIDLSDSIFVINQYGYVGSSTRQEILYALSKGKQVYWLEEMNIPKWYNVICPEGAFIGT